MRILQVVYGLPPLLNNGGASRSTYELSAQLARRGHEVTVFTTDKADTEITPRPRGFVRSEDGFDTYVFKNISRWLANKNLTYAPEMARMLKRKIGSFDVVHLHEYRHPGAIMTHDTAKRSKVPYVFQARGTIPVLSSKSMMKRTYDALWGRSILEDSSRLIALTSMEQTQYQDLGVKDEKIEIIPNAFDMTEYETLPERGAFRARMGIEHDDPMILYLGRINKIKGIDLLVKAFLELSEEKPSSKLVIAGPDDGYQDELKRLVSRSDRRGNILFSGPLHGRDKISAYVDADVYVLPSTYEIFGKTLLESCACRTPVMVTKGQGLANAIDGRAGVAVDMTPKAMRQAMVELLEDDELRRRLGNYGRRMVRDDFSWESTLPMYERTYDACLQSS